MILCFILLLMLCVVAYHRFSLKISSGILIAALLLYTLLKCHYLKIHHDSYYQLHKIEFIIVDVILITLILAFNFSSIRRQLITNKIFQWYKSVMPEISRTEQEALEAGTVNWAGELFNGKPDWSKLQAISFSTLSTEEKNFIEGPVEILCQRLNEWKITHYDLDLPQEIWQFLRENGFFGLIIPKQYGGKAFSALAHSEIISKIYGVSAAAGTTVSVPNSLGPAELILHYGTPDQKKYYLPRLASGEEIPCFALTAPTAGSDAASIVDTGVICKGMFDNKEIIGIQLNWNKRYITLAPCATLIGLAFKLYDPDKLLSDKTDYGITCALMPTHLPGITIGRRHFPLGAAFLNGPTQGKNVFVPLDMIIGGIKMAGQGWRMLMECLATGRAISLPSTAIGGAKMAVFTSSAYAHIRQQFHLPIGKFEGISEVLSRMAGHLYVMESAKNLTMSIIDKGEKPAILSAMMKYHLTELGRKIACDAMDIHGGKGICLGPTNYLGRFYQTIPIAITVEGANILTRSLIIFGQGTMRCHKYILKEYNAARSDNPKQFDDAFWGHVGLLISNKIRTFFLGLTEGYFVKNPVKDVTVKRHYQRLTRYSSAFACLADYTIILLGAKLKRREKLSGRFADIHSYLYLISAVLKNYESQGQLPEDKCFVDWVCAQYFFEIQEKLSQILENFPYKIIGYFLKMLIFPLGKNAQLPSDYLSQKLTDAIFYPSKMRNKITQGAFKGGIMAELEEVFIKVVEAEKDSSLKAEAEVCSNKIINVDDFAPQELLRR